MNISRQLKIKRDRENRDRITDRNISIQTIEDESGNEIEIVESDAPILEDRVNSLNTLVGDVNIIPGNNITIDVLPNNTIRISSSARPGPEPTPAGYDIGWKLIDFEETFELFNIGGMINNEGV